jgi:hypothetical protein
MAEHRRARRGTQLIDPEPVPAKEDEWTPSSPVLEKYPRSSVRLLEARQHAWLAERERVEQIRKSKPGRSD